ncbi:MAG TPA: STAS domain-containing protein [Anaerolineae bacterium]|nr:STAS domain-containing protein [Anaerolineae bacterium]
MEITTSKEQGKVPVTVLHVKGNIDSTSYEQFQRRAEQAIKSGAKNLVIDLRDVPYMSSAGLRALNAIYNQLREGEDPNMVTKGVSAGTYKSPHLKLLAPSKRVMETLKMSGFDMFLDIQSNLQEAVASF